MICLWSRLTDPIESSLRSGIRQNSKRSGIRQNSYLNPNPGELHFVETNLLHLKKH